MITIHHGKKYLVDLLFVLVSDNGNLLMFHYHRSSRVPHISGIGRLVRSVPLAVLVLVDDMYFFN
jgi:hypothetical protein